MSVNSKVFKVERSITTKQSFEMLVTTMYKEVKYHTLGQVTTEGLSDNNDLSLETVFTESPPEEADLWYGISFEFAVANFKLWITSYSGNDKTIVDFRGTDYMVKSLILETPIPIIKQGFKIKISYTPLHKDTLIFPNIPTELIRGYHCCGVLQNTSRNNMRELTYYDKHTNIPKLSLKPIITLHNGNIYDKNIVNI